MKKFMLRFKKSAKQLVAVLLVLILLSGIWMKYFTKGADAAWFDESFAYRQSFVVTNNASTGSYQVMVGLNTHSLISLNKLRSNCEDIRFTDYSGNLLTHWTEYCSNTSGANSVFWVTLPTLSTGTTSLFVYYGNPSASSVSTYSSLPTGIHVGSGKDGAVTISSDTDINTADSISGRTCSDTTGGDAVIYTSTTATATGAATITLDTSPSGGCLTIGDEVFIANMQGRTTNNAHVGKYETARVMGISSNVLTLNHSLANYYEGTTQKIIVQRIPNYTNVTLSNSGTDFTSSGWDGTKGGVVAFRANGTVTVASNTTINANSKGYRGGFKGDDSGSHLGGENGESYDGSGQATVGRGGFNESSCAGVTVGFAVGCRGGGNGGGGPNVSPNNGAVRGGGGGGGATGHTNADGNGSGGGGGAYAGGGGGGAGAGDHSGNGGNGGTGGTAGTNGGGGGGGCLDFTDVGNGGNGGNAGSAGSNGNSCGANGIGGQVGSGATSGSGGAGSNNSTGAGGGGGGGGTYGTAALTTLFLGSGGGGGGMGANGVAAIDGVTGGDAGGIVWISAATVTVSGAIQSNGDDSIQATAGGGSSGAGSGGSILITAESATLGTSLVAANGGASTNGGVLISGGGAGGVGRIAVNYSTSTGSTNPSATTSTLPIAGSPSNEEKTLQPLAYWKFDEASGTIANNSISNNHKVTLAASTATPTWVENSSCISGSCLKFDGSNDYASSSANIDLTQTSTVTIQFWMKWGAYADNDALAMEFSQNTNNETTGFFVDPNASNGTFTVSIKGDSGTNTAEFDRPKAGWHHFAFVLDKSEPAATEVIPYIDGVAVSYAKSFTSNNTNTFGNHVLNFMSRGGASLFGSGLLDEVKVYPYSRTAAQIKADVTALSAKGGSTLGSAFNSARIGGINYGITHYYKFDETSWTNDCSTTSIKDSAGSADLVSCPASTGPTTPGAGKYGNAGSFDGSDDQIGRIMTENYGKRWASSLWFKTSDTQGYLLDTRGDSGQNGAAVFTDGANTFTFFQIINNVNTKSYTYTSSTLDGNWHHLLVTRDGDNAISFYIDKVKLTPATQAVNVDISSSDEIWNGINYGNRYTGNVYALNGSVDEARLYSRSFTQNDVNTIYDYGPMPVGYWKLDEKTGTSILDSSGNGISGTWNGTGNHFSTGKIGGAMIFNGSTDYLSMNSSLLNLSNNFTVATWLKITDKSLDHLVVSWGENSVGKRRSIWVAQTTGYANFSGYNANITSTKDVADGNWHYVAVSVNSSNGVSIYVDGSLVGSGTPSLVSYTYGNTVIGANPTGSENTRGALDDVKIYNYVRSAKQISSDMIAGHPTVSGARTGNVLGYWKFDEGHGTLTHDSSGNGNNGTLTSMATGSSTSGWTNNGKYNKGISFDGGDDVVTTSLTTTLQNFTAEAWVYPLGSGNSVQDIISKRSFFATETTDFPFALSYNSSNGSYTVGVDSGNNFNFDLSVTTSAYSPNVWHHIVTTYDSSTLKIYIDGVLAGSATGTVTLVNNTGRAYTIGRPALDGNGGNGGFNGKIDEVKLYNYALNADDVKLTYNHSSSQVLGALGTDASGNPSNASDRAYCPPGDTTATCGPVGEWLFEEKVGTSANDTSGNARTGTLTSGPTWGAGKVGSAVVLDGIDDMLSVTENDTTDPFEGSVVTVQGWINFSQLPSTAGEEKVIFYKQHSISPFYSYKLFINTSNVASFCLRTVSEVCVTGSVTLAANQWYHVSGVYNGSTVNIYTNSFPSSSPQSQTGSIYDSNQSLLMGGAFGSYVRGRIDHVQIYNYARSVAQVSWDYNRGAPVAHWKMDECQGSTLYDSSGNGLLGTYVMGGSGGATIGDCVTNASTPRYNGRVGKFNNALDFDGSTNYVTITGTVPVDSVQGSYSAWIKTGTDFGSDGTILSGCGTTIVSPCPGNGYGAQSEIHLHVTSDERIGLFMLGGDNNISITSPAGKTYNDSQWHHVVATWSTSGGTLTARIYIDGKLVVSGSDVELAYNILNNQFTIGVMSDLSSRQFVGSIDDVKVYNYALTDTQIKGVYNGGAAVRFGPATGTP